MGLLDLLGKITPIVDIGLCVLGVVIIIIGTAADTSGTVDLATPSVIVGLLACVAGGLGIFAAMKRWWGVVMLTSILVTAVFTGLLAVAVVSEIWASDHKAPLAVAVDENWSNGLRQNVALQGQVVDNFCKDWVDEESCAVWYGELDLFMSMREKFATTTTPEEFDTQYPGCPANIDYNMLGENCTQAVICGLSLMQCGECDMDCKYSFEETMYSTIEGSALMSVTLWMFSALMVYWSWFVDSIETAATVAQEQIETGNAGGEQLKKLQEAADRFAIGKTPWQVILNYVVHFALFVCAFAVTGSGFLTYMSLSRDCEMVRQGSGEGCGGWSYILGAVFAVFIGLIDLLSLYGVHINYRAVTDFARSTIGFLTLCYIPIGVIMLHSAGIIRSLRHVIDTNWEDIMYDLNAEEYCFPNEATMDKDDPCKDLLEEDVTDGLGSIAALFLVLTLLLAGAVVVNTLFARTLFWAHVDDLNGVSGGLEKSISSDLGDGDAV